MGILSDIVNEDKVEMCPEACCGKPITECKCGPDCEHCDCHSKNAINEGTQGCADCEWISDETDGDITTCDDCAAEKRQTNESEKRWKQTSMSPEEAIAKYGKENVKVKKGALRNGDDMVEVFVESMNEGGYDIAELVGDVHYHNNHYDRDERKSEMQEDAAKLMMAAKSTGDEDIIASAESVEHLCHHYDYDEAKDMLNNKLQELNQLVGGNELEVEESYSPGDEMEDGVVSNCCGAQLMDYNDGHGRCSDCKEMAAGEPDEEYYESEVSRLKELSGIAEAPDKLPEPEFQLMKKSLLRSKWYLENEEMDPEMVATELRDVNAMLDAVNRSESEAPLDLDTSVEEEYMSLYNQCVAKLRGAGSNIYGVDHDVLPLDAKPNPDSPYNSGQVEENILPVSEVDNELQRIQDLVKFR